MFGFLKDRREFWLFCGVWIAFAFLLIVKIKFDVADGMRDWPRLIATLQSDAFEDIAGDLLTGLIAAYFFYFLIDLHPRLRSERKTKELLSTMLSSVVESFLKSIVTGHSYPLSKFHQLRVEDIKASQQAIKSKPDLRQFMSLVFVAKWGYPKFSNSLQLAASLGIEHSKAWMDLTDSVSRLKYHGEWAEKKGVLDNIVGILATVGEAEIDESNRDGSGAWLFMMKREMTKFLELSEAWHKMAFESVNFSEISSAE